MACCCYSTYVTLHNAIINITILQLSHLVRCLEFKSLLGWDFFAFKSFSLSHLVYSEDSDSLLYRPQPSLQVPSGIV